MPFEKESLFRRGIGRNQAALNTNAHWVWFTDCDLMFRKGCLDALAEQLQGRRDALVYPSEERCTELLREDNPMLQQGAGSQHWWTLMILSSRPVTRPGNRPLQIAHGDVCRAVGYCRSLRLYQTPADQWRKAHEDRAFRWLLKSQGVPIDIPGVYRIRHVQRDVTPAVAPKPVSVPGCVCCSPGTGKAVWIDANRLEHLSGRTVHDFLCFLLQPRTVSRTACAPLSSVFRMPASSSLMTIAMILQPRRSSATLTAITRC